MEQLDYLVGEYSWFWSGSTIIITTRNEKLLIAHNAEAAYKVRELSHGHAHNALELDIACFLMGEDKQYVKMI